MAITQEFMATCLAVPPSLYLVLGSRRKLQGWTGPPTALSSRGLLSWPPWAGTGGFHQGFAACTRAQHSPLSGAAFGPALGTRAPPLAGSDADACRFSGAGSYLACRGRLRLARDSFLLWDSAS